MSIASSSPIGASVLDHAASAGRDYVSDGTGLAEALKGWFERQGLSPAGRTMRLRLGGQVSHSLTDALQVQSAYVQEAVCAPQALRMRLLCLSTRADLAATLFLGRPAQLELATDMAQPRQFHGIVTKAVPGQSDGSLHAWMLEVEDALSFMAAGCNSRVFRQLSVLDISKVVLAQWQERSPALANTFDFKFELSGVRAYSQREFTLQSNESDTAFLTRLWRKHGISWSIRPSQAKEGAHTLVLFDDSYSVARNEAGALRYHQDGPTQARDSITLWSPVVKVVPGQVLRSSWDYKISSQQTTDCLLQASQGDQSRELAQALADARIEPPHWGGDLQELKQLTSVRMARHAMDGSMVLGTSTARQVCVASWVKVQELPGGSAGFNGVPQDPHEYVFVQVEHWNRNNLPKELAPRVRALFEQSGWQDSRPVAGPADEGRPYVNRFLAVPRRVPVVPEFEPGIHWPRMSPLTAVVVTAGEQEVQCDEQGRVKVQILGLRSSDHEHAKGAGTKSDDSDSAWVRVSSPWAGAGYGAISLPRKGTEVVLEFLGGDPDKPIIIGSVHNRTHVPPLFSHQGDLPGNKSLAGLRSKEIDGTRYNQLRLDDTPGQISAQLASEHEDTQLNLGYLTHPRKDGQAEPRGEGAELRTDQAAVVRGGQGILLSAHKQAQAHGPALERSELLSLTKAVLELHKSLGASSDTNQAEPTYCDELTQLLTRLEAWEAGSNTQPQEGGAAASAVVAISAPAGVAVSSQDGVSLQAQSTVDIVSIGHTQVSSGKRLLLRCGDLLSAFARQGIRLVTAAGNIRMQANQEDIELVAAKRITLTAGQEIILQAPRIVQVTQGAQVHVGQGHIQQQSSGEHTILASSFSFGQGGGETVSRE